MRCVSLSMFKISSTINFWIRHLILAAVIVLSLSDITAADSKIEKVRELLKSVNTDIKREESRLEQIRKRRAEIDKSLKLIEEELQNTARLKRNVVSRLKEVEKEKKEVEDKLEKLRKRYNARKAVFSQRLVALYKMRRSVVILELLLNSGSSSEMLRRARYMQRIAAGDKGRVNELLNLVSSEDKENQELSKLQHARKDSLQALDSLLKKLNSRSFEQATLLEENRLKESLKEKSINELEKSAGKLENVLSKLMGQQEENIHSNDSESSEQSHQAVRSMSLAKKKGLLSLPVAGKIIQGFGKRKLEGFSDIIFSKGLEFLAKVGSKVKAISSGRVIFAEVMPGFGNVVIVDHGRRYYSLYGKLASSIVGVGQRVTAGEIVGIVGESVMDNGNLYFELRRRGKAINPLPYFKSSAVV